MKYAFVLLLSLTSFFNVLQVSAQEKDITGTWKTIDDKTGIVKSHVEIYKKGNKYYGKVVKILDPDAPAKPLCENCDGDLKDAPIIGLEILKNFEKGDDEYEDGTILDPENGKTYKAKLWLDEEDENKLNVRGYILFLFRTQTWERL